MRPCLSNCEHGGICTLELAHPGLHDSDYCTWTDARALPKAEADALFIRKAGKPGGIGVVAAQAILTTTEALATARGAIEDDASKSNLN